MSEDVVTSPPVTTRLYICRKCRTKLFTTAELMPHDATKDAKSHKKFKYQCYHNDEQKVCTSIFLDPDVALWIAEDSLNTHQQRLGEILEKREKASIGADEDCTVRDNVVVTASPTEPDTIYCPHCRVKIGVQHWKGSQCSCGAWVTPAFKIHEKTMDIITERVE